MYFLMFEKAIELQKKSLAFKSAYRLVEYFIYL